MTLLAVDHRAGHPVPSPTGRRGDRSRVTVEPLAPTRQCRDRRFVVLAGRIPPWRPWKAIRADHRQKRLPARLPRHVQHARDGQGRRGDRAAGRSRSSVHARVSCARRWPDIWTGSIAPTGLLQPMKRVGRKGRGRVRADRLGRGARHDRSRVRRDRPLEPMARRRSCPTATTGRWASSSPAAWTGGSSTGWAHRCWTGRSVPRPGSLGYEYTMGRGRLGADPLAVPRCKFIVNWGSNTANTNSHLWSLMIEARKAGATIVTDRPLPQPDRSPLRLAHPAAPRHRRRPGPGPHARHLARRPPGRRIPEQGHGRRRAAARARARRVSARTGRGDHRRRRRDDRDASPIAWPSEQPSFIRLNYGMQRHHGGGMAVRTIACLPAIIGSWRHPGGGAMLSTSGTYDFAMDRLTRPDLSPPGHAHRQHEPTGRSAGRRAAGPAGPGPLRL